MKKIISLIFCVAFFVYTKAQTIVNIPACNDCAAELDSLNCAAATLNTTEYPSGQDYHAIMQVPYTGGNGQGVDALNIPSTGVTGLTAKLIGDDLADGDGVLEFYVYGTPSASGTVNFALSFGGQACNISFDITEGTSSNTAFGALCPSDFNGSVIFPYKVIDFDESNDGSVAIITENRKLFVYGENYYAMTTPNASSGISSHQNVLFTPMRMDLPGGVLVDKVVISDSYALVLGLDGNVYIWGLPSGLGFIGTSVYAGTSGINTSTLVPMNLPPGVTPGSIVDIGISGGDCNKASILIDNQGNGWFSGTYYDDDSLVSTWTPLGALPPGVGYAKVFPNITSGYCDEDYTGAVFYEGTDGNYYTAGINYLFTLGSNAVSGSNTNPGIVPLTASPLLMNFPPGIVLKELRQSMAISTDGRLFIWGLLHHDPVNLRGFSELVVDPPSTSFPGSYIIYEEPEEVVNFPTMPIAGISNPTAWITASFGVYQTDQGLFFWGGLNQIALPPDDLNGPYHGLYSNERLFLKPGVCDVFVRIGQGSGAGLPHGRGVVRGLTTNGQMIEMGTPTMAGGAMGAIRTAPVGSWTNRHQVWNDTPRPLLWGIIDPTNPRPSE